MTLLATGSTAAALEIAATQPPIVQCECLERGYAEVLLESSGPPVLTVQPGEGGETLEQEGLRLRLRLMCNPNIDPADHTNATPAVGVPGAEVTLFNPAVTGCATADGFFSATGWSDLDGMIEFHGAFRAGGCADRLTAYWAGFALAQVPLRINSPDTGTASPGHVDAGDLAALAERLGVPALYNFCFDYNDDGAVDAGDVARFAQSLGTNCPR